MNVIPDGKQLKPGYEDYSDYALQRAIVDGREVFENIPEVKDVVPETKTETEFNVEEKENVDISEDDIISIEKGAEEDIEKDTQEVSEETQEEIQEETQEETKVEKPVYEDNDFNLFKEKTGLTVDAYNNLPEDAQVKLVEWHIDNKNIAKTSSEHKKQLDEVKQVLSQLENDPYISSRIEQLRTGYQRQAPGVTTDELDSVYDAESPDAARQALERLLQKKYNQGVEVEFDLYNKKQQVKEVTRSGFKAFVDMGSIDPRMKVDISEKDYYKLISENVTHPEWQKIESSPLKEAIQFFHDKNFNWEQVEALGPDGLYKLFAAQKGWDKQAIKNTVINEKEKLINMLRNPRKAPKPQGNIIKTSKGTFDGFDLEKMRQPAYVSKLLKKYEYNTEMRQRISMARDKAYETK